LSLTTALRSSLFGCGDDDLFTYHVVHNGAWDIRRAVPESVPDDDPVADAMRFLHTLHEQRVWAAPSQAGSIRAVSSTSRATNIVYVERVFLAVGLWGPSAPSRSRLSSGS
jgi:hypothetical protein